jgi:hypothetical protein
MKKTALIMGLILAVSLVFGTLQSQARQGFEIFNHYSCFDGFLYTHKSASQVSQRIERGLKARGFEVVDLDDSGEGVIYLYACKEAKNDKWIETVINLDDYGDFILVSVEVLNSAQNIDEGFGIKSILKFLQTIGSFIR